MTCVGVWYPSVIGRDADGDRLDFIDCSRATITDV